MKRDDIYDVSDECPDCVALRKERNEADAERNVANAQLALIEEAMINRGIFPKSDAQPHEVIIEIIKNMDESHIQLTQAQAWIERARGEWKRTRKLELFCTDDCKDDPDCHICKGIRAMDALMAELEGG